METDIRLKQLSYSSLLQLHNCPRKFQLHKLGSQQVAVLDDNQSPLTFAYGHAVGLGIQMAMEGKSESEILFALFQQWDVDLYEENEKQHKSFWLACYAVQKFIAMRMQGFLDDYELVYYQGKPACELGFIIRFPDGYCYRGYVDAVLKNRHTGAIVVLEVKTTSSNEIDDAQYKNSAQAIGYSIVLDVIFPDLSEYEVFYLPYKTKIREFELKPYTKSYLQRAQWIQELLLDIEILKLYESTGVYPQRGESCYSFFRQCEYFGVCGLSTAYLTKPVSQIELDTIETKQYTVNLTLADLLDAQVRKATGTSLENIS